MPQWAISAAYLLHQMEFYVAFTKLRLPVSQTKSVLSMCTLKNSKARQRMVQQFAALRGGEGIWRVTGGASGTEEEWCESQGM